jgi:hypothetical protein
MYNNGFNKILITLKVSRKQYNKKILVIILMLLEYVIKGPAYTGTNTLMLSKNKYYETNKKLLVGY